MNISTNIKTVDENGGIRNLVGDEVDKAMALSFSIALDRKMLSRILYRGISKKYLADRLIRDYEEPTDYTIASRLFFFGEKSAHFRNEMKDQEMRKYLNDIEDVSPETSNKIFGLLNGLRKSKNFQIDRYQRLNEDFFSFFLEKGNKPVFSKMISELGQEARDYFLGFLHTAGKIGIGSNSISVSTSHNREQAELFAGKYNEDRYVIISVNRHSDRRHYKKDNLLRSINKYGVPTLPVFSAIFDRQKEQTLRAGIFPHDIIGIECLHTNYLILNPFIFAKENHKVNIMDTPLDIDQSDFPRKLAQHTNYSSYFYTFDRSYLYEGITESEI